MKNWGEEIWNEKTKDHSDVGVILGTGYSVKKMNANTDKVVNTIATDFIKTLPENSKILDIGVGPAARFAIAFCSRKYNVTGVDISNEVLIRAKKNIDERKITNCLLEKHDLVEMKGHQNFDGAYCLETFFHIPAHLCLQSMKNVHDSLKPNAFFLVQFAVQDKMTLGFLAYNLFYMSVYTFISPILKILFNRKSFYTHVSRYSTQEIEDICKRSEFKIINRYNDYFLLQSNS